MYLYTIVTFVYMETHACSACQTEQAQVSSSSAFHSVETRAITELRTTVFSRHIGGQQASESPLPTSTLAGGLQVPGSCLAF